MMTFRIYLHPQIEIKENTREVAEKQEYSASGESPRSHCEFEWMAESQLYFHASSGFYYEPKAGWYYNGRDGAYYKFENGSYVRLDSNKDRENDADGKIEMVLDEAIQDDPCLVTNDLHNPPPPSEWLEETLINLYLNGYSNPVTSTEDDSIEEGERIEKNLPDATEPSETLSEEENWQAQFGQAVQSEEKDGPCSSIIDLWDWAMKTETVVKKKHGKKKKIQIARLIGRLVKPAAKVHPSMPSGGPLLKTAVICEANLALVRVSSGQVYRLKTPSLKYLSSLATYDSSNPTRDWGFPELTSEKQMAAAESPALPDQPIISEKNKDVAYRDRAAERRALHGGNGVGPGQKNQGSDGEHETSVSTEVAAAHALHMSFGAGSYARKLLENMGWKEGEALGKTSNGLVQPLEAVGNTGLAGLGWNQQRRPGQR
ncbi:hypothetical protein ACHQM5_007243 [Ranunculus cassubicifolius]